MSLIGLLIYVLITCLIVYLILYVAALLIPDPTVLLIVRAVVLICLLIWLLHMLGVFAGVPWRVPLR